MILIDGHNIVSGGGLVLLNYLIKVLEQDDRDYILIISKKVAVTGSPARQIICPGPWKRNRVLSDAVHQYKPSILFCFGNYPPSSKFSCKTITYVHNPYLVFPWKGLITKDKLLPLRQFYLRQVLNNTDIYLFQNNYILEAFVKHYGNNRNKVLSVMPFFDDTALSRFKEMALVKKDQFFYASLPHPHKNHQYLLHVWEKLQQRGQRPVLLVTIPKLKENGGLLDRIEAINREGARIVNLGILPFEEALEQASQSEFCIYPSLMETLGLGLIEAANLGCKVIAADLPYTRQVIEPSLCFDPKDISSGVSAVIHALENKSNIKSTTPLITNRIKDLLELLN